jgi:hypothetical protein
MQRHALHRPLHTAVTQPRTTRRTLFALAALLAMVAVVASDLSAAASHDPSHPGGVSVSVLGRGAFTDDIGGQLRIKQDGGTNVVNFRDAADMVVARIAFEPGGSVGWHTHPGPALVTVTEGALTIVNAHDCVRRVYSAGEAFVDPGQGNTHVGFNDTAGETVVIATFLDVPAGQSPTVHTEDPGCAL